MEENVLNELAERISTKTLYCTKEVLTAEETARYMGVSKAYVYKLTMRRQIPFYKPLGKMCYFNRHELEEWLQSNRIATSEEINDRANEIMMRADSRVTAYSSRPVRKRN